MNKLGISLENEEGLNKLNILHGVWLKDCNINIVFFILQASLTFSSTFMSLNICICHGAEAVGTFEFEILEQFY